jgi:hypothetical protein
LFNVKKQKDKNAIITYIFNKDINDKNNFVIFVF